MTSLQIYKLLKSVLSRGICVSEVILSNKRTRKYVMKTLFKDTYPM